MNKFLFTIIISMVLAGCGEKYPDNYTKDLPFGLSYYESKSESEEKLKLFVDNKVLMPSPEDDSHYYYTMNTKDGTKIELAVDLRYNNDSLYYVDVREYDLSRIKETTKKKNHKNAISFFKENEIGLNLYAKSTVLGNTDWSNGKYEISLFTGPTLIIVFHDNRISERLSKKYMPKMIDEDTYCRSIIDPDAGLYAATVTDAGFLIIGIRPIGSPNLDVLAKSYLDDATNAGLHDIKGCFIVDYDKSKWQDGAVVGERIGRAYK